MALSVMGLLLSRDEGWGTHNLNTGQTLPVTAQTSPPAATNYRESGLVHGYHQWAPSFCDDR
jgi:hypothetical protein